MRNNVNRVLAIAVLCLMGACAETTGGEGEVIGSEPEPELGETSQELTGRCHAYRRDKGWVIINGYTSQGYGWCCELPSGSQYNHCYACDSYDCTYF
jgi:hypothetical protein